MKFFTCGAVLVLAYLVNLGDTNSTGKQCFSIDNSGLKPKEFFSSKINRNSGRLDDILNSIQGLTSEQSELLGFAKELSESTNFNDQWTAMWKSLLYSAVLLSAKPLDLCPWAHFLDTSGRAARGEVTVDEYVCAVRENIYVVEDAILQLIKYTLQKNECPIDYIGTAKIPECSKIQTACKDNGHTYAFESIWEGHRLATEKYKEPFHEETYQLAKKLYESKNPIDNLLAAITTTIAVEIDWLNSSDVVSSEILLITLKYIGLIEEGLENIQPCDCQILQKELLARLENYVVSNEPILKVYAEKYRVGTSQK